MCYDFQLKNCTSDLNFGDIELPNFLKLLPIKYGGNIEIKIKIKQHNLKTKNKTTIEILILAISSQTYKKILKKMENFKKEILLPSKLGVWEWRQTFYNKITGEVFFCTCFKQAIEKITHNDTKEIHKHLKKALKELKYKTDICHICNNTNSDLFYCVDMYGSSFQVKYGAYIEKLAIEKEISLREAENELREKKGIAKIGEKWINETLLFNYIKILFPKYDIIREASPEWIGQQRLDIYIPKLNLAIEYQGQQHFKAVKLFGGKEGLEKTKERDKLKLQKCKKNKVDLVYFTYKEKLSEKLVMKKLKKYLDKVPK